MRGSQYGTEDLESVCRMRAKGLTSLTLISKDNIIAHNEGEVLWAQ